MLYVNSFNQVIAVVAGTLCAISDGMQYGWTAPTVPILLSAESPVPIEESDIVWLESLLMLGGLAGLPVTMYLVDKVGRKRSILFASTVSLISWIIVATAHRIELLYFARFFVGMAGDVSFVATPMYIAEVAEQHIRGFLAGIIYIMALIGLTLVYTVAPFVQIYVTSIVGAAIVLAQICFFSFMPESPYYLLMKGQKEQAAMNLAWLRNYRNVDEELKEITAAVARQQTERGKPQDLVLVDSNRKALVILCVLNAAQHFSSVSVMYMNMHLILAEAGSIYLDSRLTAILFGVIMLCASTIAVALVDKAGRKILLTTSSLLTGLSLATLATYFAFKNAGYNVLPVSWIPIVSVMVYAAVFKYGLGIIPIILTGELFPTSVKAMGMTIADTTYVLFGSLSIFFYQILASNYGIHLPFFVFAASCVFTAWFCAVYVPETKGKTLEEIQAVLKGVKVGEIGDKGRTIS